MTADAFRLRSRLYAPMVACSSTRRHPPRGRTTGSSRPLGMADGLGGRGGPPGEAAPDAVVVTVDTSRVARRS
jgi:hypothetical protein